MSSAQRELGDRLEQFVPTDDDNGFNIFGYRRSIPKTFLTWTGIVCSLFLPLLVFYWKPRLLLLASHSRCALGQAEKLLIVDQYQRSYVITLMELRGDSLSAASEVRTREPDFEINERTRLLDNSPQHRDLLRFFVHEEVKYMWSFEAKLFQKLITFPNATCDDLMGSAPLRETQVAHRRFLFGENSIVVPVTSIPKLMLMEVFHPFYVFQVCTVILWMMDSYEVYASAIIFITMVSICVTVYETHKTEVSLKEVVSSNADQMVLVERGRESCEIPATELVPGDVIEIPRNGCDLLCDAVLLSGNCIVNESMLTGESVPVTKMPLLPSSEYFTAAKHTRHILFGGTRVIQTRNYPGEKVKAVVYRTGFLTGKGELVRSIMFPKPIEFQFNRDAVSYVKVLSIFAAFGFGFTIYLRVIQHASTKELILSSLDIITTIVPPALPAAMTVGIVIAQSRLRKSSRIFCISPHTINVCGSINVVAFDKTGTLTEDGLDLRCVLEATRSVEDMTEPQGSWRDLRSLEDPSLLSLDSPLLACMAACHSLTRIEGELCGDPLDLKMFEAIGWELVEPHAGAATYEEKEEREEEDTRFGALVPRVVMPPGQRARAISGEGEEFLTESIKEERVPFEIGILREFPFSSSLQRMGTIGRVLGSNSFTLFIKGSPEMVASLCRRESLPLGLTATLASYTQQGFRVLAVAWKPLERVSVVRVHRASREELERDLCFAGLLVMENRLKQETIPAIEMIQGANIRTVMVTGDNMLTAVSVARECGMLLPEDHVIVVSAFKSPESADLVVEFHHAGDLQMTPAEFQEVVDEADNVVYQLASGGVARLALSGKTWQLIRRFRPDLVNKIAVMGAVFSRFSPDQKAQLVEALQDVDYFVCMCGDGANDCGALKLANAGISLSEAEASVASPFTSQRQNISCVPALIREGRCSLVTSFGIFKFMALYSILQFCSVLLLYSLDANLSDWQYLHVDLITITTLCITFGYVQPSSRLHPEPPPVRLISVPTVISLFCNLLIILCAIFGASCLVQAQPWYFHAETTPTNNGCYDNAAVFSVTCFMYITLAVVCAKGEPYRKPIFNNKWFLLNVVILYCFDLYLVLYPFEWLRNLFQLWELPRTGRASMHFKLVLVGIALAHFFLASFIEAAFGNVGARRLVRRLRPSRSKRHRQLFRQLSTAWPPITLRVQNARELDADVFSGASETL